MESNLGSKWAFLKLRQPREGKSTGYKITRMRRSRIQAESESEMPSLSSSSFLPSPFRLLSSRRPPPPPCSSAAIASSKRRPNRIRASMSGPPSPVAEFPYLPPSHRDLMLDLRSAVEDRLGPHLLPSAVPPDVLSFHSPSGASRGSLDIRSGGRDSPVDFILESWLHCELPTGALNITTLFAFLDAATDAPHLLMEFIQSSPSSLILFTDLLPRKDLVLHPDYLDEFYQQTNLDKPRQELAKLPQVQPYCSSSLYIRSVLSPTAIAVCINCGEDGQSVMEDIMRGRLDAICKEIVRIWLDTCASSSKQLGETERADLLRRDGLIKNKTIEIDLAANLPRMFSPDVANRVVGEIQKAFKI